MVGQGCTHAVESSPTTLGEGVDKRRDQMAPTYLVVVLHHQVQQRTSGYTALSESESLGISERRVLFITIRCDSEVEKYGDTWTERRGVIQTIMIRKFTEAREGDWVSICWQG